ncbi:MAG TPA: hypothetical protein VH599_08550 [Ktedonobacterales bacterium]
MKSQTTKQFRKMLAALPTSVQREAKKAFELFQADPSHPGLNFERVQTKMGLCYSARIGIHYRAVARQEEDAWVWFWIGSHAEYDQLRK